MLKVLSWSGLTIRSTRKIFRGQYFKSIFYEPESESLVMFYLVKQFLHCPTYRISIFRPSIFFTPKRVIKEENVEKFDLP